MLHGSCLCGSIHFTLTAALRSTRYCHCVYCRKFSGTSPATWAMGESASLEVTRQDALVSKFDSGRGLRCFCAECGSPLWFESLDHPEIVGIPLGALDDGEIPPPEMHLWVRSRPDWCTLEDDLPEHETHPSME